MLQSVLDQFLDLCCNFVASEFLSSFSPSIFPFHASSPSTQSPLCNYTLLRIFLKGSSDTTSYLCHDFNMTDSVRFSNSSTNSSRRLMYIVPPEINNLRCWSGQCSERQVTGGCLLTIWRNRRCYNTKARATIINRPSQRIWLR